MRFGMKEKELELILDVFRGFPRIEEVILFGSRAMGTFRYNSDIDLAIMGARIDLPDVIGLKVKLEELPLPFMFDVVGLKNIANAALLEHITKHGAVLYSRQAPVERVSDSGCKGYAVTDP